VTCPAKASSIKWHMRNNCMCQAKNKYSEADYSKPSNMAKMLEPWQVKYLPKGVMLLK